MRGWDSDKYDSRQGANSDRQHFLSKSPVSALIYHKTKNVHPHSSIQ